MKAFIKHGGIRSTDLRMSYCRPHFAVLPPLPQMKRADVPLIMSPSGPYIPPEPGSKQKNLATNNKSKVDQVLYPVGRDGWWANVWSRMWTLPMINEVLNCTQL
jgi:hypothetical protein